MSQFGDPKTTRRRGPRKCCGVARRAHRLSQRSFQEFPAAVVADIETQHSISMHDPTVEISGRFPQIGQGLASLLIVQVLSFNWSTDYTNFINRQVVPVVWPSYSNQTLSILLLG